VWKSALVGGLRSGAGALDGRSLQGIWLISQEFGRGAPRLVRAADGAQREDARRASLRTELPIRRHVGVEASQCRRSVAASEGGSYFGKQRDLLAQARW
jgi:hypothetical protein